MSSAAPSGPARPAGRTPRAATGELAAAANGPCAMPGTQCTGLRPGGRVVRVAARLPPQQPRAVLGDAWREGALDLHEPVFEEALHQFVVHGVIVGDRQGRAHPLFFAVRFAVFFAVAATALASSRCVGARWPHPEERLAPWRTITSTHGSPPPRPHRHRLGQDGPAPGDPGGTVHAAVRAGPGLARAQADRAGADRRRGQWARGVSCLLAEAFPGPGSSPSTGPSRCWSGPGTGPRGSVSPTASAPSPVNCPDARRLGLPRRPALGQPEPAPPRRPAGRDRRVRRTPGARRHAGADGGRAARRVSCPGTSASAGRGSQARLDALEEEWFAQMRAGSARPRRRDRGLARADGLRRAAAHRYAQLHAGPSGADDRPGPCVHRRVARVAAGGFARAPGRGRPRHARPAARSRGRGERAPAARMCSCWRCTRCTRLCGPVEVLRDQCALHVPDTEGTKWSARHRCFIFSPAVSGPAAALPDPLRRRSVPWPACGRGSLGQGLVLYRVPDAAGPRSRARSRSRRTESGSASDHTRRRDGRYDTLGVLRCSSLRRSLRRRRCGSPGCATGG